MEKDAFKLKLDELSRCCFEVKEMAKGFGNDVDSLRREKSNLEDAIAGARDEQKKILSANRQYKEEFDEKKVQEYKQIEKDKREAKQILSLAEEKMALAEKHLISAQSKEASANGLFEKAEAAKKEWEDKRNKVKDFLTSVN